MGSVPAATVQLGRLTDSPCGVMYCRVFTVPASAVHSAPKTVLATCDCFRSSRTGSRMSTSREVPNFCTCTSPKPIDSTVARVLLMSAVCVYSTSITVPPVNSMDR